MGTDKVLALAKQAGFHEEGENIIVGYNRVVVTKRLIEFAALLQQQMIEDGWRQCAVGQGTTQFCGIAEELRKDAERQWVGLTDDEIVYLSKTVGNAIINDGRFARAIEAKLKEKNGG